MFQWSHFFSEMEITKAMLNRSLRISWFQWSHFFSEMEMNILKLVEHFSKKEFQWSHFFSEMEMQDVVAYVNAIEYRTSFNGATSFQKWKLVV